MIFPTLTIASTVTLPETALMTPMILLLSVVCFYALQYAVCLLQDTPSRVKMR